MIEKFKQKIRRYLWKKGLGSNFFSQGGEDAILYGIFYKKLKKEQKGFYIDVGAYHPVIYSNTHFFYLRGWSGINIDANPGSMKEFDKKRRRDINLEMGVDSEEGDSTFYILDKKSTMNSFSKTNLGNMHSLVKNKVSVKTVTLAHILSTYVKKNEEIDFLNVDVEGMDQRVLESNDWQHYKPNVIVVELRCKDIEDVNHHVTSIYLKDKGYRIVAKNLLKRELASVFFVSQNFDY